MLNSTFLIYHAKLEKQSKINNFGNSIPKVSNWHFRIALKAQKRLFVPSFAGIGTGVALRLIFATWCVVKGIVWKLRCLLYPAVAVKQTTEERNLLYLSVSVLGHVSNSVYPAGSHPTYRTYFGQSA